MSIANLLEKESAIPVYDGPNSVVRGSRGRRVNTQWETYQNEYDKAFLEWPKAYLRKYKPLKSPADGHILSDEEIDLLLNSLRSGFKTSKFESTDMMLNFLKMREQLPEKIYGSWESDISVVRFFTGNHGEKEENILSDIRALNEKENMGNVKIPGTEIELINYSPCPNCNTIHSFSDIFSYYQNPEPDPKYSSKKEQYQLDTRVKCKECGKYFLPALIVTDGAPKNDFQLICRSQTMREVTVFMQSSFNLRVMTMKKENILEYPDEGLRAWRNDVDSVKLKLRPALYANFLQYTPANMMLNFISGRNLSVNDPVYGVKLPADQVRYYDL